MHHSDSSDPHPRSRAWVRRLLVSVLACLVVTTLLPASHHAMAAAQQADDDPAPADEGALFLLLPVGSQAVGLARAMTVMATSEAAFWNPAGLAGIESSRAVLHRGEHIVGDATAMSVLLHSQDRGTLGLSYQLVDAGTQALTDAEGNTLGSISVRNHQAFLSAAANVLPRLFVGMNVKYVLFDFSCRGQCPEGRVRGSSYAVDLGTQLQPFESLPLRLGAVVVHLGPDFQVENAEQADPLPARIRVGASYDAFQRTIEDEPVGVELVIEIEDRLRDPGSPAVLLGTQIWAGETDRVFVRAGYSLGDTDQVDGAAVGFGLRYDRVEIGISRSLARQGLGAQQAPVHVSLGVAF